MRQLGDTLVWLAMIMVVVAVVYFTPRVSKYVAAMGADRAGEYPSCPEIAYHQYGASTPAR